MTVILTGWAVLLGLMAGCGPEVPDNLTFRREIMTAHDVAARDALIAAQEQQLFRFRCQFDFDTHTVPGGCVDGRPVGAPPPTVAPMGEPAPEDPTREELAARDELVLAQEALLNDYRCRFNVETQLVPNGCPDR
ncbi:hypothetical protein [Candidatus Poriferisocius sp.]|uniref:hypothetical protein n=1 Tax=Candidatus Poriferisocius sp. TaxID=3101276 RepID=UPI003B5A12D2